MAVGQIISRAIADGAITTSDINDGDITHAKLHTDMDLSAKTLTVPATVRGPATLTIDPAAVGDNTGLVVIAGSLQVDGTTTTINSTTMTVDDKNIVLASGAGNSSAADGAGITIDGASATMLYTHATTSFDFNKSVNVTGNLTGATLTGTLQTASQTNITSVGALTGLQLTGVVNNNSTLAPTLTIERSDPVPADFAKAGQIVFKGTNSAAEQIEYASIEMNTDDVTDSTEDGRLRVNVIKAGTKTDIVDFTSSYVQLRNSIPLSWQNAGGAGKHTVLQITTPTTTRTITLPNATGTAITTGNLSDITSVGTLTGLTTSGDINLLDNDKIKFGQAGDLEIYHDASDSYIKDTGTGNLLIQYSDLYFSKDAGSTHSVVFRSTGNVGIGTTGPFSKLHIEDTSWSSGSPYGAVQTIVGNDVNDNNWGHLVITDTSTGTGHGGSIRFATGNTSALNPFSGIQGHAEGTTWGGIGFDTRPQSGTATRRMTIDSKGNIGIGLSPETDHYSAYVNIDFGLSGLLGSASSGTNTTFLTNNAYLNTSTNWIYKEADEATKYNQVAGSHVWESASSGSAGGTISFSEVMRVNASGTLSLGPDATDIQIKPASKNNGINLIYMRGNASGDKAEISLNHYGYHNYHIGAGLVGNGKFSIGTAQTASSFVMDTSGYVGIGTASPDKTLTVRGTSGDVVQAKIIYAGSDGNRSGLILQNTHTGGREFGLYVGNTSTGGGLGTGFGISDNTAGTAYRLYINSSGNVSIGTTDADKAQLSVYASADKPALLLSNADGSINPFAHRNSRYLTSNGTNWLADGKDPIAVIAHDNTSTSKFATNGLAMHNETNTVNCWSPPITFGARSASAIYNSVYGYIGGRKIGTGVDANWNTGEIWIDTAGTKHNGNNQYMDDVPAIRVRTTGTVDMPWQACSFGTFSGANPGNNTGFQFSAVLTQGLNYNNHATHGYGFTVQEAGYYMCFATALYAPGASGYVYIGWCLNGSSKHHWHSNHSISSNHDFVSGTTTYCNVGDHLSVENVSASITSFWGGAHSQYYIWKVG